MEKVHAVRELEKLVISDTKNANSLIALRKHLDSGDASKDVRMAALHSLRRVFVQFLDEGRFAVPLPGKDTDKDKAKKLEEYRKWLMQQFHAFQDALRGYIAANDLTFQAPAIRTLLEFVKRDHLLRRPTAAAAAADPPAAFGVQTYSTLLAALVSVDDIDFDVIIMLRDEVFSKPDCAFYALLVLRNLLHEASLRRKGRGTSTSSSSSSSSSASATNSDDVLVKNCLDLLRFIAVPTDEGSLRKREGFLVDPSGGGGDDGLGGDGDSSGDEDEDNDGNAVARLAPGKAGRGMKRVLDAPADAAAAAAAAKKPRRLSRPEQLVHLPSHRRAFAKAWLALLALPLSPAQHKIALKHLPDHVIGELPQPLLLADYLTQSYEQGGVVAVLALESLFALIVKHNLDYPKFFASLYRLCTCEVLSAKYRGKFMKLLTMSLRSANMPAYLVAAFAKRLAGLALRVPGPSALYCVAQVTWLLRHHPECSVLVHRLQRHVDGAAAAGSSSSSSSSSGGFTDGYDPFEEHDLEKANALQSSLWELDTLAHHHLHTVATFAQAVQAPHSTADSADAPNLAMDDFLEHTYASMLEADVKKAKKNAPFAFVQPTKLIPDDDIIAQCFGGVGASGKP